SSQPTESCIATGSDISLIHRYRRAVANTERKASCTGDSKGPRGPRAETSSDRSAPGSARRRSAAPATEAGGAAAAEPAGGRAEAARQTTAPWEEVNAEAGESATHARDALGQLIMALRQVMAAGTEEQQAQALEIITDARRKLYGILAEDGSAE